MTRLAVVALVLALTSACGGSQHQEAPRAAETATPTGCQPHIELVSAEETARELGRPVTAVLGSYRINLWERPGENRGRKVGEMVPGSRAVILGRRSGAYHVRSPLDGAEGWINDIQVARTLSQDVESREPCTP